MGSYISALQRLAESYRAAEAEIVAAYFEGRKGKRGHLRWLKAQAFKEYSAIRPLVEMLARLHPYLNKEVGMPAYEELAEKLAEETRHARLIMGLLEEVVGRRLTPERLLRLPEDRKLARVRARYSKTYAGLLHGSERLTEREIRRKDEALERAAITLTEGGGGALYEVCGGLSGRGIEKKIAAAFREIHSDEVGHKNAGARDLKKLVKTRRDFLRAAEIIGKVSAQRLRMRNEQFGFPLSARKIRELERDCAGSARPD